MVLGRAARTNARIQTARYAPAPRVILAQACKVHLVISVSCTLLHLVYFLCGPGTGEQSVRQGSD